MNIVDRRAALGAFAGATFLAACGEPKPEVRKIPEVEKWPTLTIPGKVEPRTIIEVNGVRDWQYPKSGVEEFMIVSDSKYPIIAVCALMDKINAKTIPFSSLRLDGRMGFQKLTPSFNPNVDFDESFGRVNRDAVPPEELSRFGQESARLIDAKTRGEIRRGRPAVFKIMSRPEGDQVYEFGPGVFEYRGQRNSLVTLAIKFQFEKLDPAFSKI